MTRKIFYKSIQIFRTPKRLILFGVVLFFIASVHAGVVSHPRKMTVVSTTFFDVIFSAESVETATILTSNADDLYRKACKEIGATNEIRILVVISPDSDVFSVTYSPTPYNRIVIYDAVPDTDFFKYDQILLDAFYHEVLKAVSQSIRNSVIDIAAKIFNADSLQPAYIFNLPFSFIEGVASLEDENKNVLNDNYNLQLLMQAKLDGKFPSWINVAGSRDIYPSDNLSKIAGIAFAAYLQQRYGVGKYIDFWRKSGNIYFVIYTKGIFYNVYEEHLEKVWQDFYDSIPLPHRSHGEELLDSKLTTIFANEFYKLYSNLISTPYGLVWYDDLNHEVSLYNPNGVLETRRLLFLADDVTKLSADETGRFLSISFLKNKSNERLHEYQTWIYDLRDHTFFSEKFDLSDACIVTTKDGLYAVAGVNVQKKNPRISILLSKSINKKIFKETDDEKFQNIKQLEIFSRDFEKNIFPYSLSRGPAGTFVSLLKNQNETLFYSAEIEQGEVNKKSETLIALTDIGTGIDSLQPLNNHRVRSSNSETYSFQFFPADTFSFARTGCITFDVEYGVSNVVLQKENISGGVYSPALFNSDIYFYSKKTDYFEFRYVNVSDFYFGKYLLDEETKISMDDLVLDPVQFQVTSAYEKQKFKKSDGFSKYNPLKYMFHGSWAPFLPVRDIYVKKGNMEPEQWPGLGISYSTQSDPLENNDLTFSAAAGFLDLSFKDRRNPTDNTKKEIDAEKSKFANDFAGAAYFRNTATPVTIATGGIIKFTLNGQYNFKIVGAADWTLPLGMPFRRLNFNLFSLYNWSTKYNYAYTPEERPDLFDWPSLGKAYRNLEFSTSGRYSNVHQAGISPYEMRGIESELKFYSLWDFASLKKSAAPSLVSFSVALDLYASRLNPLPDYYGWILGLPSSLSITVLKDEGTAYSASSKIMVIGKEIQEGVSLLNLYFTRFGLSVGYDLDFDYAIKSGLRPDIRSYKQFTSVFANTVLNDKISVELDFVFSPVIGHFSRIGMNGNFKFTYGIQTGETIFAFDVMFRM